jgi:hypothetical protein
LGTFTVSVQQETVNVPNIDLARRMRRKWFADPTESVQKGGNGWSENVDAFPLKHGESQDSPAQRVGTALPVVGR